MSDPSYTAALNLSDLPRERRQRLLDHLTRTNALRPPETPLPIATAYCAALLLSGTQERHVAVPTALALAETLCASTVIGPGVMALCDGSLSLHSARLDDLGISRGSLQRLLTRLAEQINYLARALEPAPVRSDRSPHGERPW